jgi:FKBP-type peptidyl-prolyl cis-trans isomerase FklB
MKKNNLFTIAVLIAAATFFSSCKTAQPDYSKTPLKTHVDSVSYIIGADIGGNLRKNDIQLNLESFIRGYLDATLKGDTLLSPQQVQAVMGKFQKEMMDKQNMDMENQSKEVKEAGQKFLDENKKKDGVKVTASGLQYKVLKEGNGEHPTAESTVTVNYEGKFLDGKIFDSSYERGEPATFPLNGVIKGWTEGVQLMKPGAIFEFYIPSDLGYGDNGYGGIPGGSTLIFKVELISIK